MGSARQLPSPNTFEPLRNHGDDQIAMNTVDPTTGEFQLSFPQFNGLM